METKKIQVIIQKTYAVFENGKKQFLNEKPLIAISDKKEAIKTTDEWNNDENKNQKEYKNKYHLEFVYDLKEITLWLN